MDILEILWTLYYSGIPDYHTWALPLIIENCVGKELMESESDRVFDKVIREKASEILIGIMSY